LAIAAHCAAKFPQQDVDFHLPEQGLAQGRLPLKMR
jgi:hypothetical protein